MKKNGVISLCLFIILGTLCFGTAAFSADDIRVVSAIPQTGPFASDGEQMQKSLEMAVAEYNEKGGVLGRKIKIKFGDVGGLEPEKIQAVGERLMGSDPDLVITGYDDSGVNTRVFGKFKQPYLHCVAMTEATKPVAENPEFRNVFQYCPNDTAYGTNAAANIFEIPKSIGWNEPNKKIAIIAADYSYNVFAADAFKKKAEAKGYETAIYEIVPFGVVEWGPMLSKIKREKPAYITLWVLEPADMARFMIQFRAMFKKEGIDSLIFMQYTPNIPEFLELAEKNAEGVIWTTSIGPVGQGVDEYNARWEKRFNEPPKGIYAQATRDAFDIWVKAVEQAGCIDCYDKVVENIRAITYAGMCGNYKFDPYDQAAFSSVDDIPMVWHQIWGGKHNITGPGKLAEFEYKQPPWLP